MPAVIKRMDEKHLVEIDESSSQNNLLNTIRIPKNLHFLTERLPKANYSPMKIKKVDKHKFLQTLAGYKDLSPISNFLEDIIKSGAESVDSHKRQLKEQKSSENIHLPSLQAHSGNNSNKENEEILKIYAVHNEKGKEKHRLNSLNKQNVVESINKIIFHSDKNIDKLPEQMILKLDANKNEEKSKDIIRKKRERENSSTIINSGHKIHENGKEIIHDKHLNNVKNTYASNSNKRLSELSPIKSNPIILNDHSGSLKKIKPAEYKNLDEY